MKKLGFGLMRLPLKQEDNPQSIDQDLTNKMVDYFLDKGFNYFDTGYLYHQGMSEVTIKKALVERHPRDSFTITDKLPVFIATCKEDYQRFFDEQIKRCGVEYFDYYFLHSVGEKNYYETLKYGGFEFVNRLKEQGKARRLGFSFHDKAQVLDKILKAHPEMEYVQLQLNYIDWDNETIESRKCYEVAAKHNKKVIVMGPVKGGALANVPQEADKLFKDYNPNMSAASWGIRFAASLENVFMVLSGMSNLEQVIDNANYMSNLLPLNDEESEIIKKVTAIINSSIAIACTKCQYCVDDCPKKIPIPKYFSLYNNQEQFGLTAAHKHYYLNLLTQGFGKPSDCINCKQCEEHCPQHLKVTEQLKKVSQVFEVS